MLFAITDSGRDALEALYVLRHNKTKQTEKASVPIKLQEN